MEFQSPSQNKPLKFFCVYKKDGHSANIDHQSKDYIYCEQQVQHEHTHLKNYNKDQNGWYEYHGQAFGSNHRKILRVEHEYFE